MSTKNINVGLMGHVDSGKTSLAKALTTVQSTACFDKHPQSLERGITIDLGFSSFKIPANPDFVQQGYSEIQVTLVDCPGHASLIKKIIGGAQIIDYVLLVIDINKGIQTQTAECLVIAEILQKEVLIVLNKIDLIPRDSRAAAINKAIKKVRNSLKETSFRESKIVSVSVNPKESDEHSSGIDELVETLGTMISFPSRQVDKPFIFSVDHCFSIKGKGTVLTGTVIQGRVAINENIEMPHLKISRKVKTIQVFKKNVSEAFAGDRIGICVTQFDAKLLERGVACAPGVLKLSYGAVINFEPVKYFKSKIISGSKFHVSIGHETVMTKITLFKSPGNEKSSFDVTDKFEYVDELSDEIKCRTYALLEFELPVACSENDHVVASKLDIDADKQTCRISFYGNVLLMFADKNFVETVLPHSLLIYKWKEKRGLIYRIVNDREVIVHSLFKKETKMHSFVNLRVELTSGEMGVIRSAFGQGGKVKVELDHNIKEETKARYCNKNNADYGEKIQVVLRFKRYIFDRNKTVIQD